MYHFANAAVIFSFLQRISRWAEDRQEHEMVLGSILSLPLKGTSIRERGTVLTKCRFVHVNIARNAKNRAERPKCSRFTEIAASVELG